MVRKTGRGGSTLDGCSKHFEHSRPHEGTEKLLFSNNERMQGLKGNLQIAIGESDAYTQGKTPIDVNAFLFFLKERERERADGIRLFGLH